MAHSCIENEIIVNIDYSGQTLENMEYEFCVFKNCNFSEISLRAGRFYETEFVNCNLSNAELPNTSFLTGSDRLINHL
ncbi:MAG: putative low-complexity protein [Bacteroidetes bacterium]|jgi:uncharacterized protein YjbI with pentapeptide repeats|nr:putative low-complexity protein [Bacteroidota bacterium]